MEKVSGSFFLDTDIETSTSTGSESGNLFTGAYTGHLWTSSSDTDTGSDVNQSAGKFGVSSLFQPKKMN
jgi:hypothetical protein